jgi:hypothetical protein
VAGVGQNQPLVIARISISPILVSQVFLSHFFFKLITVSLDKVDRGDRQCQGDRRYDDPEN